MSAFLVYGYCPVAGDNGFLGNGDGLAGREEKTTRIYAIYLNTINVMR